MTLSKRNLEGAVWWPQNLRKKVEVYLYQQPYEDPVMVRPPYGIRVYGTVPYATITSGPEGVWELDQQGSTRSDCAVPGFLVPLPKCPFWPRTHVLLTTWNRKCEIQFRRNCYPNRSTTRVWSCICISMRLLQMLVVSLWLTWNLVRSAFLFLPEYGNSRC